MNHINNKQSILVIRFRRYGCGFDNKNISQVELIEEIKQPDMLRLVVLFDSTDPGIFPLVNRFLNQVGSLINCPIILVAENQHLPIAWDLNVLRNYFEVDNSNIFLIPKRDGKCKLDKTFLSTIKTFISSN